MYSFWRFDDFSWGNTRRAVGDDKGHVPGEVEEVLSNDNLTLSQFNPNSIPKIPYPDKENLAPPAFVKVDDDEAKEKERKLNESEKSPAMPPVNATGLPHQLKYMPVTSPTVSVQHGSVVHNMNAPVPHVPSPIPMMYQPMYPMTALQAIHAPVEEPFVSDELLIQEIRRILAKADLNRITKKQVRSDLSTIFQTDLKSRKAFINMCIDKILQGDL